MKGRRFASRAMCSLMMTKANRQIQLAARKICYLPRSGLGVVDYIAEQARMANTSLLLSRLRDQLESRGRGNSRLLRDAATRETFCSKPLCFGSIRIQRWRTPKANTFRFRRGKPSVDTFTNDFPCEFRHSAQNVKLKSAGRISLRGIDALPRTIKAILCVVNSSMISAKWDRLRPSRSNLKQTTTSSFPRRAARISRSNPSREDLVPEMTSVITSTSFQPRRRQYSRSSATWEKRER
jgi:hypothetical protein